MEAIDPARYVLPALLALMIVGSFVILVTSGGGGEPAGAVDRPAPSSSTPTKEPAAATAPVRRFATVKQGDTATSIADAAAITTDRLIELNPSIDPESLRVGQTLKLAP